MLRGEPAFRRETGVETLHAVLKEPAPRLAGVDVGAAGPVLQRVLDLCLAKAPEDRYPGATALLGDLREARRRLEQPPPPPPVPPPLRRRPSARRRPSSPRCPAPSGW